jgi:hypothetical protein
MTVDTVTRMVRAEENNRILLERIENLKRERDKANSDAEYWRYCYWELRAIIFKDDIDA